MSKQYAKRRQTLKSRDTQRRVPIAKVGETKYFDCDYNSTGISACTTTWVAGTLADPLTTINLGSAAVASPGCLLAPTVGAALNQRVGRQVFVHKIKVRGTITVPLQAAQAGSDNSSTVRILLVQDQHTNAAQMTSAQLLNDGTAAATVIDSYQNPNNFGRFRVLKDKRFKIDNLNMAGSPTAADVVQASAKRTFQFSVVFKKPVAVHFNATNGGTILDIVDNSFHLIAGTDSATYGPLLAYYSRVTYKDV